MARAVVSRIVWISAMVMCTGSGPDGGVGVVGVAETSGVSLSPSRSSLDVDPRESCCCVFTGLDMLSCSLLVLICNKSFLFLDDACFVFCLRDVALGSLVARMERSFI